MVVLPRYYKQQNFNSFLRQVLSIWFFSWTCMVLVLKKIMKLKNKEKFGNINILVVNKSISYFYT